MTDEPMVEALTDAERADALDGLPDWDHDEGRDAITRRFLFAERNESEREWRERERGK